MAKEKKAIKVILFAVMCIPAFIFIFNYFLAHRLENYLKKELISRVSDATNHFYALSYENLSINLFNGELRIEGIEFKPDPVIFNEWQLQDSLPDAYFKIKIGVIDFTGINLIWRWSYKHLNFNTFEIHSPTLEIYNTSDPSQSGQKDKTKKTEVRTLYELVEPYINILTVGTLNLEHAYVSYNVENPLTPIIYKLDDVSFHAYSFRLDSLSSKSGKLLYSDNFDFVTNRNQTLLSNNEFSLLTDSIRLSTQDSIIFLENIHLIPQEKRWDEMNKKPANYVDGQIEKVLVDGIFFTRENALNYLKARTFGIYSPDIKVYNLAPRRKDKTKRTVMLTDSLMQPLSLYDLISPILHSVSIDQVSLENTTADYFLAVNGIIETYHLDDFNFHAYEFLVDSLTNAENTFWYAKNFTFDAKGLEGLLKARNHRITVGRVNLDTEKQLFRIENVHLRPVSTQTPGNYMEGSIRSINIEGLAYDNGISAELFQIESPDIRYVWVPGAQKKEKKSKRGADKPLLISPFLDYLSIRNIRITDANTAFSDKNENDTVTYKLNDFDFYATNFFVNNKTINREDQLFFNYKSFGFNFSKFDNYVLNKDYRLTIDSAVFTTATGLRLEKVELYPLKTTGPHVSLKAPLIELSAPSWALNLNNMIFGMQTVSLDRFRMMNAEVGFYNTNMRLNPTIDMEIKGLRYDNEKQDFDIKDIYFHTKDFDWTFSKGFYNLRAGDILFSENKLRLQDVLLESPYSKEDFSYKHPKHLPRLGLKVKEFSLSDINLPVLIKERAVIAGSAAVDDVVFEVYKDKKVPMQLSYKPMINEYVQKLPLRIDIDSMTVRNMDFIFELLSKKGKQPGKLMFMDINGVFYGVTNIVKYPDQYIKMEANAKFMDNGYFTSNWLMPVDSLNKQFFLDAHMPAFDFTSLNAMIGPVSPIRIQSGQVNDLTFSIKGTDLLADIQMQVLYDNLKVEMLKEKNEEMVKRWFTSAMMNMVVRNSNPRRKNSEPHITNITSIERDVNRSTFNFIWQILRPALADAVGVSETGQHVAKEAVEFIKTIKSLFRKEDDEIDE